jgi:hypothetical protein
MLGQHWQSSHLLRFARSCLASSYRWAPGRDLRCSATSSTIYQVTFQTYQNTTTSARKFHLIRGALRHVSTSNTHHHMPVRLGTANKAAQKVIHPGNLTENDLSHWRLPISVQANLHLAVVGVVWRDWFCGKLQGS